MAPTVRSPAQMEASLRVSRLQLEQVTRPVRTNPPLLTKERKSLGSVGASLFHIEVHGVAEREVKYEIRTLAISELIVEARIKLERAFG